jgi:sugar transferase (PEP-CTERM/EpsH1 system associated)
LSPVAPDTRTSIAQIVENLNVGGLERVVIGLIEKLDPSRFRSVVFCLRDGGALLQEITDLGVRSYRLNKGEGINFGLFVRLARLLRREKIDIVHCHNFGPLLYGAIAARIARLAGVVYTAHGQYSSARPGRLMFRHGALVDSVVCVSEDARRVAIEKGGVAPERVITLINGVDMDRFAGTGQDVPLDVPVGSPTVGIVARLTPVKDHRNLFRAFANLLPSFPRARLLVVGDGELRGVLEDYAAELGLGGNVTFLGDRRDVPAVLGAFDLFVLSSYSEGLSITLLEAMAAGLPIVATDIGGNPEVVNDGETGMIVPAQDPDALSQAMAWVFEHPAEARRMGERGRERVRKEFSIDAMIGGYEQIYRELLG